MPPVSGVRKDKVGGSLSHESEAHLLKFREWKFERGFSDTTPMGLDHVEDFAKWLLAKKYSSTNNYLSTVVNRCRNQLTDVTPLFDRHYQQLRRDVAADVKSWKVATKKAPLYRALRVQELYDVMRSQ